METLITEIQDAYTDCTTCREAAEAYAKIMMESKTDGLYN